MTNLQDNQNQDVQLGEAVDGYLAAVANGERPDIDEYIRQFPEIAELLKLAIPTILATDVTEDTASTSTTVDREKRLGDFRILRQIGRGGMGIVYEAEQVSMARHVALKVLPLAGLVDELKIKRFQNEVRAVAALDHPHIVSVYMVGLEDGVHYYAMQLIRGQDLAQVIHSLRTARDEGVAPHGDSFSRIATGESPDQTPQVGLVTTGSLHKPAPGVRETVHVGADSTVPHETQREYYRNAVTVIMQAASALQHAHEQGIVHRDIKPANLLLDTSASVFVTDFGLARVEADVGVTMTGDLVGTLRYMAPEQALGNRVQIDHRADIYSLAATLYELLALRPAYDASNRQQLLKQIAFEEPVPLRKIDPHIPADLGTIIQKAMSKDLDERYISAQEFADDLRRFLDDRPIQARPPTITQVVSKWTRRNPAIAWATIVTLSLVTIAFGMSTLLVSKQRDKVVQAKKDTEDQLRLSTVTRLAAESQALQDERPIKSALLAVESVELSQQLGASVLPIAHEALLNAAQRLRRGRPLTGHGTTVTALKMSPDWLVTLGKDNVDADKERAHLWDLTSSTPSSSSRLLGDDNDTITSIEISKDGRWLVTGGSELRLWDLRARNPDLSSQLLAAGQTITSLSLSPSGQWLVAQSEDGTIRLWDLNSADPTIPRILLREAPLLRQMAVSSNGRWLASVRVDRPDTAQFWELDVEDIAASSLFFEGHNTAIRHLAMTTDGRWLASGDQRTVRLWDLKAENPAASSRVMPTGAYAGIQGLTITPDVHWLFVTTFYDSRIIRWDLTAGDPASTRTLLREHTSPVYSLSTDPLGRWLISGSIDGTARLWNLDAKDPSSASVVIRAHDEVNNVAMHPGGRWLATVGTDKTAMLWDLQGVDPESSPFVLQAPADDTFSATAISSDGRWIATSGTDNAVQLWDLEAKDLLVFSRELRGHEEAIETIEISADDRWLVTRSRDLSTRLWDLTRRDLASSSIELDKPADGIVPDAGKVAIDPTSRWLATGGANHEIRLWDLKADQPNTSPKVLRGHKAPIMTMLMSPDGRWLVTAENRSGDDTTRLWDIKAEQPQASLRILGGNTSSRVFSMAIDADSRWLATESDDYSVRLWDLKNDDPGESSRVISAPGDRWGNGKATIWLLAISPNGRWLFTGRMDRSAHLWDLNEKNPTPRKIREYGGAQAAAISSDGRWLATGGKPLVHLWDLTAPDPIATSRILRGHKENIWSLRMSADSRWLVSDSSDGTIRRWSLDMEWLLKYAREVAGRELTNEEKDYYQISVVNSEYAPQKNGPD